MPCRKEVIGSLDCRACEHPGIPNVFAIAAFYKVKRRRQVQTTCPRPLQQTGRAKPMLFWIAAIGSTWGAYALGFEGLVGVSDRTETRHGGRERRTAQDQGRTTDRR